MEPGAGAAGGYWDGSGGAGMAAGKAHSVLLLAPQAGQAKRLHWVVLRLEK